MFLFRTTRLRSSALFWFLLALKHHSVDTAFWVDLGFQLIHVFQVVQLLRCLLAQFYFFLVTYFFLEIKINLLFDSWVVIFYAVWSWLLLDYCRIFTIWSGFCVIKDIWGHTVVRLKMFLPGSLKLRDHCLGLLNLILPFHITGLTHHHWRGILWMKVVEHTWFLLLDALSHGQRWIQELGVRKIRYYQAYFLSRIVDIIRDFSNYWSIYLNQLLILGAPACLYPLPDLLLTTLDLLYLSLVHSGSMSSSLFNFFFFLELGSLFVVVGRGVLFDQISLEIWRRKLLTIKRFLMWALERYL